MLVLEGVRVADFSRVLAGPYCAQLMADMGADVIKVEAPAGDENRSWPPLLEGHSTNFASVNRGKRSITLNLKSPEASTVIDRLAGWADVVLHSFLPDTAQRLGLVEERLREINPRLIFCAISGYGEHGPLRNKPGYDAMVQAFGGVMSTTGEPDGPPMRTGVSFLDMATGLSAYSGIVTALMGRTQSGRGTRVTASLLETAVALLGYHAVGWLQAGILPERKGSGSWHLVPYQAFRSSDGFVMVGAPNDAAWKRLCAALDKPQLAEDPRFLTNADRIAHRDVLLALLQKLIATKPMDHWNTLLEGHGVAVAPIHTIDQVMSHPQVLANNMVVHARTETGTTVPLVGTPFKLAEGGGNAGTAAPGLGADRERVLAELAFTNDEIETLSRAGAI